MGYSDFVIATPEPQLAFLSNLLFPGFGTMLSAYYKKGGLCMKTFALGFV